MRRRITKIGLISLGGAVLCLAVLVLAFVWRLSLGPISLGVMSAPLEALVNANLSGMRIGVKDAIIERSAENGRPRLRLRDVKLTDRDGNTLALAPRASLAFDGSALLHGELKIRRLELIGPHILVRRDVNGAMSLGVGDAAAPDDEFVLPRRGTSDDRASQDLQGAASEEAGGGPQQPVTAGKSDAGEFDPARLGTSDLAESSAGQSVPDQAGLLDFITKELLAPRDAGDTAASSLESIIVSNARVSLYDAGNNATWDMPDVNLSFQREQGALKLIANADIASGPVPWKLNVIASYDKQAGLIVAKLTVQDLVPADVANKAFALAELAEVKLPLSGEAHLELAANGEIRRAEAVLSAGAGYVGFPDYLSSPILVDEGVLRLHFDPASGDIVVGDSAFYSGGSQAKLNGRVHPVQATDGRISSLRLDLKAHNIAVDTTGRASEALLIDNIDFVGTAALQTGTLTVDDLILRAGDAGVRLRGTFIENDDGIAVRFGARLDQVSLEMLKKLWPPVAATAARNWINRNVLAGVITKGEMIVDLPAEIIAAALQGQPIPDDRINFTFDLAGVDTRYFDDLPPIQGATGSGVLRGDSFDLQLDKGKVTVPSGTTVELVTGTMKVTHLMVDGTRAAFDLTVNGPAHGFMELIDLPPLQYLTKSGVKAGNLQGQIDGRVAFDIPLKSGITASEVTLDARTTISDVRLPNALDNISIDGGELAVTATMAGVEGRGHVLLNGIRGALDWRMSFIDNAADQRQAVARISLDDKERSKLGLEINDLVQGTMDATITVDLSKTEQPSARVDLDLSKATLIVDSIDWRRPPAPKTHATMHVTLGSEGSAMEVKDFHLSGTDLDVRGSFTVNARGDVQRSDLPVVKLGKVTDMSVRVHRVEPHRLEVTVDGRALDARPMIEALFNEVPRVEKKPVIAEVKGTIDRMIGFRNEQLQNVDFVARANERGLLGLKLNGRIGSRGRFEVNMEQRPEGRRGLTVTSDDAGAVLRGSEIYSRVRGGRFELTGLLEPVGRRGLSNGLLRIQNFEVADEPALQFDEKGRPIKQAPRQGQRPATMAFSNLHMPFLINAEGMTIGETLLQGPALGATAKGTIRKPGNRLDIGGTIIPVYALNSILSSVPVLGEVLMGGKGQGMFGVTFAIRGTIERPEVYFNPISALAPGFLRKIFEFPGAVAPSQRPGPTNVAPRVAPAPQAAPQAQQPQPQPQSRRRASQPLDR